jgi:hypothetical protein
VLRILLTAIILKVNTALTAIILKVNTALTAIMATIIPAVITVEGAASLSLQLQQDFKQSIQRILALMP